MSEFHKLRGALCERYVNPVFFVFGATGCGKSATAVALAETLQGSGGGYRNVLVVNCDVQQFYIGLPIATNKMQVSEMRGVAHCFLSFLSVDGHVLHDPALPYAASREQTPPVDSQRADQAQRPPYNIHDFTRDACRAIDDHFERNHGSAVVVCGGTAYYLQSLLLKNTLVASEPLEGRKGSSTGTVEWDASASALCPDDSREAWDRLRSIDPDAAARYHPNNTRRILRLLQVYGQTGQRPSVVQAQQDAPVLRYGVSRTFLVWVNMNAEKLNHHLDARVDAMVERGLLEEVQTFHAAVQSLARHNCSYVTKEEAAPSASPTNESECRTPSIIEAIGYKELASCCVAASEGNKLTVASAGVSEALHTIKGNTRRYAKQQLRWIQNRFVRRFGPLLRVLREGSTDRSDGWTHFVKLEVSSVGSHLELEQIVGSLVRFWMNDHTSSLRTESTALEEVTFPLHDAADTTRDNAESGVAEHTQQQQQEPSAGVPMTDLDARYIYCDVCEMHVHTNSSHGMGEHEKTKRHRGAVRHHALVEKQRQLGREIPPRKRTRQ